MTLISRAIIIEEDEIKVRFDRTDDNPYYWNAAYWIDGHWEPVIRSEPFEAPEVLWYAASTAGVGEFYEHVGISQWKYGPPEGPGEAAPSLSDD